MKRLASGFTIVELLIVIVIIGILASIAAVGWGNLGEANRDRARNADMTQWTGLFETYKGRYRSWPALPDAGVYGLLSLKKLCLGKPAAKPEGSIANCGQYQGAAAQYISTTSGTEGSNYTSLMAEIAKVSSSVPKNTGPAVDRAPRTVGPLLLIAQDITNITTGEVTVTGKFINFFERGCPSGWSDIRSDGASVNFGTAVTALLVGVPASGTPYPCRINPDPTFKYDPTP